MYRCSLTVAGGKTQARSDSMTQGYRYGGKRTSPARAILTYAAVLFPRYADRMVARYRKSACATRTW